MNPFTNKYIFYLLLSLLIFSFFKLFTDNKLNNIDLIIIVIITIILCKLFEKYILHKIDDKHNEQFNQSSDLSKLITSTDSIKLIDSMSSIKDQSNNKLNNKLNNKSNEKDQSNNKSNEKDQSNKIIVSEEMNYPFSFDFLKLSLDNIIKSNNDPVLLKKIQNNTANNEYYEILIQILQTNTNEIYKYINHMSFNKINELIMDIKQRRNYMKDPGNNLPNNQYFANMCKEHKYFDENGFVQTANNNDLKYNLYTPQQSEKLGANDVSFTNKWDDDYILLNTDKWRPPINNSMYKCKTDDPSTVYPNITSGYPVKLKDFNAARKILPPDIINIDYIKNKLNTGLS